MRENAADAKLPDSPGKPNFIFPKIESRRSGECPGLRKNAETAAFAGKYGN